MKNVKTKLESYSKIVSGNHLIEQIKKFDKQNNYLNKWVVDLNEFSYPDPMVEHAFARNRAIASYKEGLMKYSK